ncbi:MAG: helix-turn-helix domain-containing protein [Actinomadura sp.]
MSAADLIDPTESIWDWLAYDLRVYRLKHNQTLSYVGDVLNRTKGWVSNVENGRRRLSEVEARKLDRLWNTSGHFLRLITYAKRGHDPDWGRQHLEHESKASVHMIFELALIPGLLQTDDYARVSFTAAGVKDVEGEVAKRMARQQELYRPDPPMLWVLLDEGVLDRVIGGPHVMKAQLAKLLEMSELPHVSIRVVPRSAGWHFGLEGAFEIMTGPAGDVAYTEACGGGRLVTDPDEVRDYRLRHARIGEWALPVDSSRRLIERKLEAME